MPETKKKTVKKTTKKAAAKPNNAKLLKTATMKVNYLEKTLTSTRMWCAAWCILSVISVLVNLYLLY